MISTILNTAGIVLPLFALIFLGWAAGHFRILREGTANGLSDYVFSIAVPILIFNAVTSQNSASEASPWTYWIAYFSSAFSTFAIGMLLTMKVWGKSWMDGAIQGFASGQSNIVFVGVPVILAAFGPSAQTPMFMLLALHMPIMTAAAMLTAESEDLTLEALRKAALSIVRNPIFIGIALGVIAHMIGFKPTGTLSVYMNKIGATATPCGLIALGMVLQRQGAIGSVPQVVILSALKLCIHPALVLIACLLLGVPEIWAKTAVIFAAMPCGLNAFLLAQKYGRPASVSAAAISISTLVSLPTIALWLALLNSWPIFK